MHARPWADNLLEHTDWAYLSAVLVEPIFTHTRRLLLHVDEMGASMPTAESPSDELRATSAACQWEEVLAVHAAYCLPICNNGHAIGVLFCLAEYICSGAGEGV